MQNLIKRKIEYILLAIILLAAFGVRLYKINNPLADWHSFRQSDTSAVSRIYLEKGINLLYPRYYDISKTQSGLFNPQGYRYVEFPIYNALQALAAKTFPQISLEVWGRLISIFWAEVSIVCLYFLGRRFLGKAGGILAAFFFAFLPYSIYFTRVILPEPMAMAWALMSLIFFVRFIDSENRWSLYLSGAFLAVSLLIKPFTVFYLAPMFYLLWDKYGLTYFRRLKNWIPFVIFGDVALVPLLAWRIWISRHPEGIPLFTWMFNADGIRFRPAFFRWIFAERIGRLILGDWGLVPFLVGILATVRKNFVNLAFFLGMLAYTIIFATANVRHDYYQIYFIPAIALLLAQGSLYLWEARHFNKFLARAILLFSLILALGMSWFQVKEFYKINHPEIIAAGKEIQRLTPPKALVIAPYNGDTTFLYQTHRMGWPVVDDSLTNLIRKGATHYVSVSLNDADTVNFSKKFTIIEKTPEFVILDLTKAISK